MNHQPKTIEFQPAIRDRVSLIIALASASGGGKTLSALKIARGLAGGDDGRLAFIDTEARRGLHYAVAPNEKPGPDRFAFVHHDMRPPFTPEAYADAIQAADRAGYDVICVDSCTHEWEGEGGLQEIHDELVAAAVQRARSTHQSNWGEFDEARAADRASVGAWKEPKARHKRFISRLLQCRAHLILCLRADEKIRMETVEEERNGRKYKKTVIIQPKDMPLNERWVPICEKRFMYEMTLSLVLTPQNPGVPIPIKLQAQHRDAVPLDRFLSEDTGRALAEWARGGQVEAHREPAPSPGTGVDTVLAAGRAAAAKGNDALKEWWSGLGDADATRLRPILKTELKPAAAKAGVKRDDFDEPAGEASVQAWADQTLPVDEASYKTYAAEKIAGFIDPEQPDAWFVSDAERELRNACHVGKPAFDALQASVKARANTLRKVAA